ncbi:MAG: tRNA 2-thiouridine(34) synthase MnmA [Actinobacteria bacterium]|nr:tRNA 2-thiouridine(34) synthase MnmA [Actinomycetota bacterium]
MKALVAMSGGVDSSVAAALMKERGHEVIGVTLKLWSGPGGEAPTAGCCTVSDAEDARRVAAQLDIPYYVLDYTGDFGGGVVDRFVADYAAGRTPNPCIECNRTVKFDALLSNLDDFDCEVLATGHHARIEVRERGPVLLRGVDPDKDQSYVLSMLGRDQLARLRFPIGELTKTQVRAVAAELGLRTATKAESMDICFVGRRDYRSFLHERAPHAFAPGAVVDTEGRRLGDHQGVAGFTIGQRRGLRMALGEPRYVVDIDPGTATVVVGTRDRLAVSELELSAVSWVGEPVSGAVTAQYRAHGEPVGATLEGSTLVFETPQEAVAPGQTVSFYRGDEVVGGALIAATAA